MTAILQSARRAGLAFALLGVVSTAGAAPVADVVSVRAAGASGSYDFAVGIRSPDRGCDQYADWWEVLDGSGRLLYRRVLLHSHVDEQPFVRSGGPVPVRPDQLVYVRAHMNPGGYGGAVFKGSVDAGFRRADAAITSLPDHSTSRPLPDGCGF